MLRKIRNLIQLLILIPLFLSGCADLDEDPVLESINVVPETCDATVDSDPKQFRAWGYFDDGSSKDLTLVSIWTHDATGDSPLSSAFPGLVYFRRTDRFAIVATYHDTTNDVEWMDASNVHIISSGTTSCN